jgi:hypothetical protein
VIVISGALVLVALVLLVIGLIDPSLGFVYASIGVSFAFLVVGILQRRKEVLPEMGTVPSGSAAAPGVEGITAILPTTRPAARVPAVEPEPAAAPVEAQREHVSGQVLVVAGRPRYHVGGCRYLTGKDADAVDVADAREEGFTACGVCKPDLALEVGAAASELTLEPSVDVAPEAVAQVDEVEVAEQAPVTGARVARADQVDSKASKVTRVTKAVKTAAPVTGAATPPIRVAKAAPVAAKAVPAPAKAAAAKSSPAKKAATAPTKRGVVVIPDRGKFHTAECRYVRGAEGTLELTRAAATRQGYQACGVCNP